MRNFLGSCWVFQSIFYSNFQILFQLDIYVVNCINRQLVCTWFQSKNRHFRTLKKNILHCYRIFKKTFLKLDFNLPSSLILSTIQSFSSAESIKTNFLPSSQQYLFASVQFFYNKNIICTCTCGEDRNCLPWTQWRTHIVFRWIKIFYEVLQLCSLHQQYFPNVLQFDYEQNFFDLIPLLNILRMQLARSQVVNSFCLVFLSNWENNKLIFSLVESNWTKIIFAEQTKVKWYQQTC